MSDRELRAKKEYEAEVYRQTHPYEQWIAEHESGDRPAATPGAALELSADAFCALADEKGGEEHFRKLLEDRLFVMVIAEGGVADPRAAAVLEEAFRKRADADIIYADEDTIDREGRRSRPWFKPDWSPDTFGSFFYFGDMVAFRASFLRECLEEEMFCSGEMPAGDRLWHLTDKLIAAAAGEPLHLPEILLHMQIDDPQEDVFETIWARETVTHLRYPVNISVHAAKVSVIIPSKDHTELLRQCIGSLTAITDYPDLEIIVVDNGSSEENRTQIRRLQERFGFRYLYEPEEFNFSRMCNRGASVAAGDLLLFLNDDIEVIAPDWMSVMAGQALHPHTGAVGAKMYYPKAEGEENEPYRIQHCGITNIALGPVHKLGTLRDKGNLYHMRNRADMNVLAVTGACLMVTRERYTAVGGFDEGLAIAYNDVDFCFSLYEKGWYNVVRADAVLIHHESASRGSDESPEKRRRREAEMERLYTKHPALYGKDPFYSPHLSQERLSVEYLLGYDCPYERAELRSMVTAVEAGTVTMGRTGRIRRKLGLDPQITGHLDTACRRVRFGENGIVAEYQLEGWAAPAKKPAYRYERQLLLLREDGSGCRISLFDKYRPDAKAVIPEQEAWELAGYVARIPEEAVEEGVYRVLLSFTSGNGGRPFVADTGVEAVIREHEIRLRSAAQ